MPNERSKNLDASSNWEHSAPTVPNAPLAIGNRLLARNTVLNFVGQALPFAVGIFTIPYVVRHLGVDRFGVLSIAWALLGYFSLFDLGLGRATTKFVADSLAKGEIDEIAPLAWTSLVVQLAVGAVGAVLLVALVPTIATRILHVPPEVASETQITLTVLAVALPLVLASNTFRGVLEAAQCFDRVNMVKVPSAILIFVLPAVALMFGVRLPGIVLLLSLAIGASTIAYLVVSVAVFPSLKRVTVHRRLLGGLLGYGGWITVSNVIGPLLTYTDRLFIGNRVSLAAVSYYTVPSDATTRLWIFPRSLVSTAFPAFTCLDQNGAKDRLEQLYVRSIKYLLVIQGTITVLVGIFARDLLRVWMGQEFAEHSTLALQIIAAGVLINSVGWIPFNLLQAVGRPDLTAKFHLIEMPVYFALLWVLTTHFGIAGAALAWSSRLLLDAVLCFVGCRALGVVRLNSSSMRELIVTSVWLTAFCATSCMVLLLASLPTRFIGVLVVLVLYGAMCWWYLLDSSEQWFLRSVVPRA